MSEPTEVSPPQTDAYQGDLVMIDAPCIRLFRTGGSAVRMTVEGCPDLGEDRSYVRVQIARAFPLSQPDRYIGFRDAQDRDIGMMVSPDGLDAESRRILDEEMERRYFLPVILKVRHVKDEYGSLHFDVDTDKGPRSFYLRQLRESVFRLPGTDRLLLTDTDGNRYDIPDVRKMDARTLSFLNQTL